MKTIHFEEQRLFLLIVFPLLFSVSCGPVEMPSSALDIPGADSIAPSLPPQPLSQPSPSELPAVLLTPTLKEQNITEVSKSTITESQIAPPLPTQNSTLVPTISPQEIEFLIRELLVENKGCKLPCWWGSMPGITSWESTKLFLMPFVSKIGQGETFAVIENGIGSVATSYGVHFNHPDNDKEGLLDYSVKDGVIDFIWVHSIGTELSYQIHQLLSEYGKPEEVLLEIDPYAPARVPIYHLVLFYQKAGIMALYEGEAEKINTDYELCLNKTGPELWLWPPGNSVDLRKNQSLDSELVDYLKPIGEATEFSIENFYSTFSKDETSCLLTPASLWE